ncbi:MAG: ADOP family duplicated permease [Gemmatimonadales bacterium]
MTTPLARLAAAVRRTLRSVFRRRRLDHEVDDEMEFHLEMAAARYRERGMSPLAAARAARAEFGNPGQIAESAREIRRAVWLERAVADLRAGWRRAGRTPLVTATIIAMLALGIGSTTTMFSITHGILRDLPVPEPRRLVHVAGLNRLQERPEARITDWEFASARGRLRSLEPLAGIRLATFHLGEPNRFAARWSGATITPNTFGVLRVAPILGRDLDSRDAQPGAEPVVLLGALLWHRHFTGDSAVVGRTIRLDGSLRTVVGVMPEGFRFPRTEDLWVPGQPDPAAMLDAPTAWQVFGRLRDGTGFEAARAELATLDTELHAEQPNRNDDRRLLLRPYREQQFSRAVGPIMGAMMFVVSFVLLIACANVAGLLIADGAARTREAAVRAALGASAGRLMVHRLAEVLVLAVGGGALGLGLAALGVALFDAMVGFELAFWMRVEIDAVVLGYATLAIVVAALLAGLAPGRLAARVDVGEVLRNASRGSSSRHGGRLNRMLVGFEVALSVTLLVVTALMVQGVRLNTTSLARLDPREVQVTQLELRADAYPDQDRRRRFHAALAASLAGRPGVREVSFSTALPGIDPAARSFDVDGVETIGTALTTSAGPGFFETFRVAPAEGRGLLASDDDRAPSVAVVNRRLVGKAFGGQSPIGRRIRLPAGDSTSPWRTIVGVVEDVEVRPANAPDPGMAYFPLAQTADPEIIVALRAAGDPATIVTTAATTLREIDPEVTIVTTGRFDQLLARESSSERLFGGLFLFFGGAALLLASVGLGGLVALSVQQQRREVGIRVALGAKATEIVRLVLRSGIRQLVIGVAVGLGLAVLTARFFGAALMGADPSDWRPYLIAAGTLLVAGVFAAWMPTRRALAVPPADVLRSD